MSSDFESLALGFMVMLGATFGTASRSDSAAPDVLRVCADPDNLPFSNRAGEGFENQIARLIGRELHLPVQYTWHPQRRGFLHETLDANLCDVVLGVPADDRSLRTTKPYYRSSYVFLQRPGLQPPVESLDDPRLAQLRIGIHVIGDDYNSLPPGVALARRGLVAHLTGFSIEGDYSRPSPPQELVDAVANGSVDLAIAWGPMVGYFTRRTRDVSMTIVPEAEGTGGARFVDEIAMGVREADTTLQQNLDEIITRRQAAIDAILRRFAVPTARSAPTLAGRWIGDTTRPATIRPVQYVPLPGAP